jgi:hypothetical protein
MSHLPERWKALFILLLLASMVGCQGFSTAKQGSQSAPQDSQPGDLVAVPASISFGNVQMGTSQTLSDALSNTGAGNVTITQATVTGAGFTATGLNLPLTLTPGQSITFNIVFTPQTTGSATGILALANDGSSDPLNIDLSGTAVVAGSLSTSPTSFNFGSSQVGTGQTQTETLTNSGGENLTISQAVVTGASFSYTGLTLPMTLAPNQSTTFGVVFTPISSGAATGDLSITVSGSTATVDIALSGTGTGGVTGATLTASPSSLTFSGVQAGKAQTQTETIQNIGGSKATITGITTTGAAFSSSGLSTPVTLSPGQTASFSVTFAPQSSGSFSGSVAIASNASNPTLSIALSGSATTTASGQLNISPTTINVGNVTVGSTGSQSGSLNASGSSITVSSDDVASSEFAISGLSFPVIIPAGQSINFTVTFTPQSSGAASAQISFVSNASNSPSTGTVTGTGVAAPSYNVSLTWTASSSPNVIGYNIYRRTGAGGTFQQINSVLDAITAYTDSSVKDGYTYYYQTTAMNSSDEESAPSTPVQAIIPAP